MSRLIIYPHDPGSRAREVRGRKRIAYEDQPAMKYWCEHYDNEMVLRAALRRATEQRDKIDLRRQLAVAQRKQEYWARHPNYSVEEATRHAAAAKMRNW